MKRRMGIRIFKPGFTVVELLIVVVVIAIIAGIVLVGYNGVTGSARLASLKSDLRAANDAVAVEIAHSANSTDLLDGVAVSSGNYLELTQPSSGTDYCINGFRKDPAAVYSYHSRAGFYEGLCPYYQVSDTKGIAPSPLIARGVNVMPAMEFWTKTGGAALNYNDSTGEVSVTDNALPTTSYHSPYIRVDGAYRAILKGKVYATAASSNYTPNSGSYTGIQYYTADCTTPVNNPYYQPTNNYTTNGNTVVLSLNAWQDKVLDTRPLDKTDVAQRVRTVQCIRFNINGGANIIWTSTGVKYKELSITLED